MSTIACARGCTQRNQHHTGCDHGDDCAGCLPRPARFGILCHPCHRRLAEWLGDPEWRPDPDREGHQMPGNGLRTAAAMLRESITGGAVRGAGKLAAVKADSGKAPLSMAAYAAHRALEDKLSSWLEAWCEHRGLHGPDQFSVDSACSYLTQWLDQLEAWPPVIDLWTELWDVMVDAHAIAPWRAEVRRCDGIDCPRCSRQELVIFGGMVDVTCGWCGAIYDRTTYDRWAFALAEQVREAEKVKGGITFTELAERTGIKVKTLHKWHERGRIKALGWDHVRRCWLFAPDTPLPEVA